MVKQIALFGGSFNPPAEHHREIARELTKSFDEVIIIPCGPRPDKPTVNDIEPVYRSTMADLAFRNIPRVRVELFDLEASTFTRTHELAIRFRNACEIWHVVGADLIKGGGRGESKIQTEWFKGNELWNNERFAVCTRRGYELNPGDLPPRGKLFPVAISGSSEAIRTKLFKREDVTDSLSSDVIKYIQRHALYRGAPPPTHTRLTLETGRFRVISGGNDPRAAQIATELGHGEIDSPELLVVIGGDGTMLHAIREHWRSRIPFYGINTGNIGFLHNKSSDRPRIGSQLDVQQLPLLFAEVTRRDGSTASGFAFNDVWVERSTGQAAWLELSVDGETRVEKLISDGALVCTAAGSTSYALAMGAAPLPFDTPVILLVGSNVFRPLGWKSAALPLTSTVTMRSLSTDRRPLHGFIDGVPQGEIVSMTVRISRTAAAELAFESSFNSAHKLVQLQFPNTSTS